MADESGFFINSNGGYSSAIKDEEDLQEEDIWGVLKQMSSEDQPSQNARKPFSSGSSSSSSSWRLPTNPKMIPKASCYNHETNMFQQKSSAPMKITDWSSVYRGKKNSNASCYDYEYDDCDDDGDEMVPPHEYIAKKLARTQISSFSMCEGIGRTLKGRDLSKVRNAILTKTGFLE